MHRPATALVLVSLLAVYAAAQDGESFSLHKSLVSAKLPQGYRAIMQPIKSGDKNIGFLILVAKPNEPGKVDILIESRAISSAPARRAAAKAYVNTAAAVILKQGYRVVKKSFPDFAKETFEKPVAVDLVFANAQGMKLWTHQDIFFTKDEGVVAKVSATDADKLAALTKWAKTITPR